MYVASKRGFMAVIYSFRSSAPTGLLQVLQSKTPDCNTPLHHAAANGHVGACRALVNLGSEPLTRNYAHLTPQELARSKRTSPALVEVEAYFEELKSIFWADGGDGRALEVA